MGGGGSFRKPVMLWVAVGAFCNESLSEGNKTEMDSLESRFMTWNFVV